MNDFMRPLRNRNRSYLLRLLVRQIVSKRERAGRFRSVAGRWDLVAIVRVKDNEDLATVVTDRIRKLPGIAGSETMISFRTYSKREIEAGFSLGAEE